MQKYIIISMLLFLISCSANYECIEADDFGFPKVSISAAGHKVFASNPRLNYPQCSHWVNSNLTLNGKRLFIVVSASQESKWAPWFGSSTNKLSSSQHNNQPCSYTTQPAPPCINGAPICPPAPSGANHYFDLAGKPNTGYNSFYDIHFCTTYTGTGCNIFSAVYENDSTNACTLTRGDGLYGLVVPVGSNIDNNMEVACHNFEDNYYTFHLGGYMDGKMEPIFDGSMMGCHTKKDNTDGRCSTSGYNSKLPDNLINKNEGDLYFKIYDSYYTDNSGQYNVIVKSGAGYTNAGPIANFISHVIGYFTQAGENIFKNIVKQIGPTINIALTLYVIFAGIMFLFGLSEFNFKTLFIHLFKISILIQLTISETSWDFFNGYLLKLFTEGVDQICCIIATGEACDISSKPAENLIFFDRMLGNFFSFETQMKIWSLVLSDNIVGYFCVSLIEWGLIFFVLMILNAAVYYVMGYIGVILLICLFPLLMPFMLFSHTKQIFDKWLSTMMSFCLEMIIIVGFLALTSQMMVHQFHSLLGFKVCYRDFQYVDLVAKSKAWIPISFNTLDPSDSKQYELMPVPEYIQNRKGDIVKDSEGNLCEPYACSCYRLPALPFLHPDNLDNMHDGTPCENLGYSDQARLSYIVHTGKYSDFLGAVVFLCMVVLMKLFSESVPSIAKIISSGNAQTMFSTGDLNTKGQAAGIGNYFGMQKADKRLSDRFAAYKAAKFIARLTVAPTSLLESQMKHLTDPETGFRDRKNIANSTTLKSDVKNALAGMGERMAGKLAKETLLPKPVIKFMGKVVASPVTLSAKYGPILLDNAVPGLRANINNEYYQGSLDGKFTNNPAPLSAMFAGIEAETKGIPFFGYLGRSLNSGFTSVYGNDIGTTLGILGEVKGMYVEHLKAKYSMGLLGQDMHKLNQNPETNEYMPSNLDRVSNEFANNYGIDSTEVKSRFDKAGEGYMPMGVMVGMTGLPSGALALLGNHIKYTIEQDKRKAQNEEIAALKAEEEKKNPGGIGGGNRS
jgi:type IV secretory pathway VirB6-like protein